MKTFIFLHLRFNQLSRLLQLSLVSSLAGLFAGCAQNVEFAHIPSVASSIEMAQDEWDPDDPDRYPPVTPVEPDPEPAPPTPPVAEPIPAPVPPPPVAEEPAPIEEPTEEPTPPSPPVAEPTPEPEPVLPGPGLPEPLPRGDQVSLRGVVVSGATGEPVVSASGQCVRTGFSTHRMHPSCESFETQLRLSLLNRAIFFDVDSSELTLAAQEALAIFAQEARDNNTFVSVNIIGPVALQRDGDAKASEVSAERALAVYKELRRLLALEDLKGHIVSLNDHRDRALVSCQVESDEATLLSCLAVQRRQRYDEFTTLTDVKERMLLEWHAAGSK